MAREDRVLRLVVHPERDVERDVGEVGRVEHAGLHRRHAVAHAHRHERGARAAEEIGGEAARRAHLEPLEIRHAVDRNGRGDLFGRPVDRADVVQVVLRIERLRELQPAAFGEPAVPRRAVGIGGERVAEHAERRVLAREVGGRGVLPVEQAVLDRLDRLGHAHDGAAGKDGDLHLPVRLLGQPGRHRLEGLGGRGVGAKEGLHLELLGRAAPQVRAAAAAPRRRDFSVMWGPPV
jgi:hypothetical protein